MIFFIHIFFDKFFNNFASTVYFSNVYLFKLHFKSNNFYLCLYYNSLSLISLFYLDIP